MQRDVVPEPSLLETVLAARGPVLILGTADAGKSTIAARLAQESLLAGRNPAVLDADVGQSEHGPPGMMDLLRPEGADAKSWRSMAHWYVGATNPYGAEAQVVAGVRRLADRAASLGLSPVIVDTTSFVNSRAGRALKTAKADALDAALLVAIQSETEMEGWLSGMGAPVFRVRRPEGARAKPEGLRTARRANRLAAYFHEAPSHRVGLLERALRGTRLGLGEPVPAGEYTSLGGMLGCPVVHAERTRGAAAVWVQGEPRHGTERVAQALGRTRVILLNAAAWQGRGVGFIAKDGFCLAQGVVESVDWGSLVATVRTPYYGITEAVAMAAGTMRHGLDGSRLPDVAPQDL